MEKKLAASEARTITNSPDYLLARIYKLIKEAAKEGATRLDFNIPFGSQEVVEAIKDDLLQQGYMISTKRVEEEDGLYTYVITINW